MGRQHRLFHNLKKGEQMKDKKSVVVLNNSKSCMKKSILFLIFSLVSFCFIFTSSFLSSSSPFALSPLRSSVTKSDLHSKTDLPKTSIVSNEGIWCDRTAYRTDICFMKGDIRTRSPSSSIFLYNSQEKSYGFTNNVSNEKIKPYTRKWEKSIMNTISELNLKRKDVKFGYEHTCDVHHDVPAMVFSTGGYTGNVYHEFNDGIIPLYITSQHFAKRVIFVIVEYHKWWKMKYGDVLSQLTDYPLIDFDRDKRTHCFKEAIVGLRIHDELTVDPSLMQDKRTIKDFRNLLDRAYRRRINRLVREEEIRLTAKDANKRKAAATVLQRPKLILLSRNGSRGITNEEMLVKIAKRIGFQVEVLKPDRSTELAKIYKVLNSSNVLVGVHGAAMTHFLFMRPGSVFVQIIPLGTDWAAETYYGEPAKKLGLDYIGYKILPRESSLYRKYDKNDPILQDPNTITKKGWQFTKTVYLDDQQVNLDHRRFKKVLLEAYSKAIS